MKQIEMPVREKRHYRYKGYLHIRCPHCGKEKTFFSSQERDGYFCTHCRKYHPFKEPLTPVYLNCECRGFSKYMTNLTEKIFDVPCIKCGMPVTVERNRKGWYEKMRQGGRI